MSTHAIIAKPAGIIGWEGVYHHFDGYPAGLGVTLAGLRDAAFGGDLDAMTAYLIDSEPVGWSTINGADWTLPKGWHDDHDTEAPCAICGEPLWRHYAQYYPEGGPDDPMVNGRRRAGLVKPGETVQLGHSHERVPTPKGPQCYSARGETDAWHPKSSDADYGGADWLYILTPECIRVSRYDYSKRLWKGARLIAWGDAEAMAALQ